MWPSFFSSVAAFSKELARLLTTLSRTAYKHDSLVHVFCKTFKKFCSRHDGHCLSWGESLIRQPNKQQDMLTSEDSCCITNSYVSSMRPNGFTSIRYNGLSDSSTTIRQKQQQQACKAQSSKLARLKALKEIVSVPVGLAWAD